MATLLRTAIAIAVTLLLLEIGFREARERDDLVPPHPDLSVSAEWAWARDHLRAGRPTSSGNARFDPDLGWAVDPLLRRAHGERGPVALERRPGVPRMVFTGDSFMRGLGKLGPDFLPDWEVVNVAVPGYGAGQIWLRHRTEGVRWSGDVVVFGFYLRDYFRTFRSFRSYAKPLVTLDEAGALSVTGVPVPTPEALYEAYRSGERKIGGHGLRSVVWDFIGERRAIYSKHRLDDADFRLFETILAQFQEDVRSEGGCPFLVIFPTQPARFEGVYVALDLRTREAARAMGLPYLSLAEALFSGRDLAERREIFDWEGSGHMSPHGIAESIRSIHETLAGWDPGACAERRAP